MACCAARLGQQKGGSIEPPIVGRFCPAVGRWRTASPSTPAGGTCSGARFGARPAGTPSHRRTGSDIGCVACPLLLAWSISSGSVAVGRKLRENCETRDTAERRLTTSTSVTNIVSPFFLFCQGFSGFRAHGGAAFPAYFGLRPRCACRRWFHDFV